MLNLNRYLSAHLGMLLWAVIVGFSFPLVMLLSKGLPPMLLTAIRFAIAVLVLSPLMWREPSHSPTARSLPLYTLMGLCLAGFFGAMFWAANYTTGLSMASLYVSVPLLAYSLGRWFGVESPRAWLLGILITGACGALALVWAEAEGQLDDLQLGVGELGFFLGCLAAALYPVLSKWGLKRRLIATGAATRTFWSSLTGAGLMLLFGYVWEDPTALAEMTLQDVLLLVYLGVFSSGLTFWLQQFATAVLTPGAVMAYSYLIPFVSMLLLFVEQPQRMGWHWAPGSALVLMAIALLLRSAATGAPHTPGAGGARNR